MSNNRDKEKAIKYLFLVISIISTSIIFFIFAFLVNESLPAIQRFGLDLLSLNWNVSKSQFGLLPAIIGSILVTIVALIISIPIGVFSALFMSEIASPRTRRILKPTIEVLAGIPSIVYGFIGIVIFVPYIRGTFNLLSGYTILTGGVVLAIMALPIIISISDDAIQAVPVKLKNASLALGATKWETMKNVTLPAAISGVSTAIILGAGRIIGETMAVMLVVGSIMEAPEPFFDIFESGSTLTSLIANNMGEAFGIHTNVLFTAGVILLIIVTLLSLLSEYIQKRVERKFGE